MPEWVETIVDLVEWECSSMPAAAGVGFIGAETVG